MDGYTANRMMAAHAFQIAGPTSKPGDRLCLLLSEIDVDTSVLEFLFHERQGTGRVSIGKADGI